MLILYEIQRNPSAVVEKNDPGETVRMLIRPISYRRKVRNFRKVVPTKIANVRENSKIATKNPDIR